jgi:hypothetical protein
MLFRHGNRLRAGSPAARCHRIAVCALVALAAAPAAPAVPAVPAASTRWRADTPLGTHAMVYLDAPYSFKEAMFRESARLGVSAIRVDLALSAVFAPGGEEDWRPVDEMLTLARQYRVRPVGIVLATPEFLTACPAEAPAERYKCPPSDLDAWKQMVSKLAAHTRGVIDTFEILNEPDGRWAFAGSAADYARMLRAGHDATVAGNPRAKVAIAGTMSLASRPWLEQVFAHAGPNPERLYDIANVHIRGSLRQLPATMRAWRAFFAVHNAADKPLWVTEFGYPSDPVYQYDHAYRSGPRSQAGYLRRALLAIVRGGAAKIVVTLRDNLSGAFASEGVITGTVTDPPQPNPLVVRKPAFAALAELGARWAPQPPSWRVRDDSDGITLPLTDDVPDFPA